MHRPVALVFLAAIVLSACDRIEELRERFRGGGEDSTPVASELSAAVALYDAGDPRAAAERLQALSAVAPNEPEVYYQLGRCHLAMAGDSADPASELSSDEQQSLDAFQTALTLNPRHAQASLGIGDLYARRVPEQGTRRRRNERAQEAESLALEAYQRAVTIDPKQPEAQRRFALFLERVGESDAADRAYQAAVSAAQANPEIAPEYYTAYGRFLASQSGRAEEAINQLELAQMVRGDDLQLREEIAELYSRIGHQYFEEKRYSLAEQTLTKAYRIFPDKSSPEAQKTSSTLNQLRAIRGR